MTRDDLRVWAAIIAFALMIAYGFYGVTWLMSR